MISFAHFAQVGWVKENIPPTNGIVDLLAKFGIPSFTSNGDEDKGWKFCDGNLQTANG